MFYYCEKCANIKNVSPKDNQDTRCDLCETVMKPVPDEYLMASGSFFKSQDAREELLAFIKANEMYDESVGEKKEELQQFEDIYEQKESECTVEVTFRLYLCSSDYAVQIVKILKKENE